MADSLDISKDLLQSLKDSRKIQGDINTDLNKSINLLSQINDLREQSISKVKSLNKQSINTKEIEKELQKVKQKSILVNEKIKNIEKDLQQSQIDSAKVYINRLNQRRELEKEYEKARLINNRGQISFLRAQLSLVDQEILSKEGSLSTEERKYAAMLQAQGVTKENVQLLQEELNKEKEISKSIGFSGKALGFFAQKLGLGTKYYEEMVEKAKDLQDENKKLSFGDKLKGLGKAGIGGIKEAFSDPLTLIPIIGGAIGGIVKGLKAAFDYIVGIQDQTVKFARAMNMSTDQARDLKMQFADVNVANGNLFVNTQKLVESQTEMVDLLGVTNRLSDEILSTNIELKDIAGLEADVRSGIVQTSLISGKSAKDVTKSVLAQVQGLKQATGIQFQNQKILKEVANLSGVLGLQFSKYPAQLTKSLLTVKAMGMELKEVDSLADSFLDFESSITKEFEAQLLTGKEINLAKAREAFLNNDLATAAAEITSQVGSAGDYLKMNRIQQESLASAMGMTRDSMADMLKKQEMLSKLGAKDTDTAREQLRLGLERYKNQKALADAIGEENYQNLVNASLQEKIAAFIEKIKQSIADFVEKSGIIEKIEGFMNYLSKPENIRAAIVSIRDVFANILDIVATIASGVVGVLDFFGAISNEKAESIQSFLSGTEDRIRSIGGDLSIGNTAARNQVPTSNNAQATNASSFSAGGMGTSTIVVKSSVNVEGRTVGVLTQEAIAKNARNDGQLGGPSKTLVSGQ